jgi:hypothetical protein
MSFAVVECILTVLTWNLKAEFGGCPTVISITPKIGKTCLFSAKDIIEESYKGPVTYSSVTNDSQNIPIFKAAFTDPGIHLDVRFRDIEAQPI